MAEKKGTPEKKNEEEEAGFSWLGAAAAFGGAVLLGYGIKKFGDMTLSDSGTTDLSTDGYEYSGNQKQGIINDDDDTIQEKLQCYYQDYVEVSPVSMASARVVMQNIIAEARVFIEQKSVFPIGELIPTGSSTDGLKVIQADEFDVLIPIPLASKDGWTLSFLPDDPGFARLSNERADPKIPRKYFEDSNLLSTKVRELFQGILQKYVNQQKTGYNIKLKTSGPAQTLIVTYSGDKKMSVDLVPCVQMGQIAMVAKPHPSMKYPDDDPNPDSAILWRQSYSLMEQEQLSMHYDEFTKCLKIMKCLRVNHAPFAAISSYVLKTAYLHWRAKRPSAEWDDEELLVNFRDFAYFLCSIVGKREICPFFESNPKANLLKRRSPVALSNLHSFIERRMLTHRLSALLRNQKATYYDFS